jgi:hypothetical protein
VDYLTHIHTHIHTRIRIEVLEEYIHFNEY